jgi:SAM-dependent methyltransferase
VATSTRIEPAALPALSDPHPTDWARNVGNRRFPRRTQWDYLFLELELRELQSVLPTLGRPGDLILDVFCGARPYADIVTPDARVIGLDVVDTWGVADVVSDEFLPFADGSFDAGMCTDAFGYAPDPQEAVDELRRVLRPGAQMVITYDTLYEYDIHRYTGAGLAALFDGWDDVVVRMEGGRGINWGRLTNEIIDSWIQRLAAKVPVLRPLVSLASLIYFPINLLGGAIEAVERRYRGKTRSPLPSILMLTARRPRD